MNLVQVTSVRVDAHDRLRVRPVSSDERGGYSLIYRAAAWVRWDNDSKELFVTADKLEGLSEQFARIYKVLLAECGHQLEFCTATDFCNTPPEVVAEITGADA